MQVEPQNAVMMVNVREQESAQMMVIALDPVDVIVILLSGLSNLTIRILISTFFPMETLRTG